MKRPFTSLTLKQAMQLIPAQDLDRWALDAPPRPPSDTLRDVLRRLESFELTGSEAAKVMLIDTVLAEVVPDHPVLKVWKAAPLETDAVVGIADYVIARRRAYLEAPLLCAVEAKRDDFDAGRVQCIAEMAICRELNRAEGHDVALHGIVSNGQGWVFYRLTVNDAVSETDLFSLGDLPRLLGALDHVCAECARNVPVT
jgi:hypothetical protein